MTSKTNTLSPRLKSKIFINRLFSAADTKAFTVFPVRVTYREDRCQSDDVPVQVMFCVSKRHFKRAVKRNRVKRQMREAYRLNISHELTEQYSSSGRQLHIAFVWLADRLYTTSEIEKRMIKILSKITAAQALWLSASPAEKEKTE